MAENENTNQTTAQANVQPTEAKQPTSPPPQPPIPPQNGIAQQQCPPPPRPGQPNGAQQCPPPPPRPPKKKKIWPWVLLACAVAMLMFIGGCCSGAAIGFIVGTQSNSQTANVTEMLKNLNNSGNGSSGGNSSGNGSSSSGSNGSNSSSGNISSNQRYTLDEIKKLASNARNQVESGNVATDGVYAVGTDIAEGLYYLQGSPDTESTFYIFDQDDSSGKYEIETSVAYTGNYYAQLECGDVIVYLPKVDDARMMPEASNTTKAQAPYQSGLYRVGTDIPAGKYKVSVYENAPKSSTQEYAAYIMKDLSFEDDSITQEVDLLKGQSREITVENGQWLELFGATATPVDN